MFSLLVIFSMIHAPPSKLLLTSKKTIENFSTYGHVLWHPLRDEGWLPAKGPTARQVAVPIRKRGRPGQVKLLERIGKPPLVCI